MNRSMRLMLAVVVTAAANHAAVCVAQEDGPKKRGDLIQNMQQLPKPGDEAIAKDPAKHAQVLAERGLEFLKSQQKPDGGWQGEKDPPGITAIVLRGFAQSEKYANEPFVQKGYEKLLSYQLENGGIYKDLLANYNTSIALSALVAAKNPAYQPNIDRAVAYLKSLQWKQGKAPEGETTIEGEKDAWFGGWGYGGRSRGAGRPDLSNAQMAIEALRDAGLKSDDEAFKNAVKFLSRTQNLSETNDQEWAGNDGGFIYGPSADRRGESMAGEYAGPDGKRLLRSYGSMTYAGLKSMIHAGLTKDDPRVKAAFEWVRNNYTLDENPGMKTSDPKAAQYGLYYYYQVMAKALNAYDEPMITDGQGNAHDWRKELVAKLATLQKADGSWSGEKRWMEDNPILVTSYVVQTLQEIQEDLKQHPPR
jgi:squalene-hopene/tetraprenyl-beta-curcumene cyclase